MKSFNHLLVALALLLPGLGYAQTLTVKPGLWEHVVNFKSETGQMEAMLEQARIQMQSIPPAQREMIEGMLAAQGIKMDFANQSFQNCISEEEAATGRFKWAQDAQCEQNEITTMGNETHVKFTCRDGEGELVMKNESEYTANSRTMLEFSGNKELVTATHSGRWLGDSCGAIGQ